MSSSCSLAKLIYALSSSFHSAQISERPSAELFMATHVVPCARARESRKKCALPCSSQHKECRRCVCSSWVGSCGSAPAGTRIGRAAVVVTMRCVLKRESGVCKRVAVGGAQIVSSQSSSNCCCRLRASLRGNKRRHHPDLAKNWNITRMTGTRQPAQRASPRAHTARSRIDRRTRKKLTYLASVCSPFRCSRRLPDEW